MPKPLPPITHCCLLQLRYRKDKMLSKLKPCFPVVKEVRDLSNGCAIAAVIHYYCPGLLRLEGGNTHTQSKHTAYELKEPFLHSISVSTQ